MLLAAGQVGATWVPLRLAADEDSTRARLVALRPRLVVGVDAYVVNGVVVDNLDAMSRIVVDAIAADGSAVLLPHNDPDAFLPRAREWGELFATQADLDAASDVVEPPWSAFSGDSSVLGIDDSSRTLDAGAARAAHRGIGPDAVLVVDVPVHDPTWLLSAGALRNRATVLMRETGAATEWADAVRDIPD